MANAANNTILLTILIGLFLMSKPAQGQAQGVGGSFFELTAGKEQILGRAQTHTALFGSFRYTIVNSDGLGVTSMFSWAETEASSPRADIESFQLTGRVGLIKQFEITPSTTVSAYVEVGGNETILQTTETTGPDYMMNGFNFSSSIGTKAFHMFNSEFGVTIGVQYSWTYGLAGRDALIGTSSTSGMNTFGFGFEFGTVLHPW